MKPEYFNRVNLRIRTNRVCKDVKQSEFCVKRLRWMWRSEAEVGWSEICSGVSMRWSVKSHYVCTILRAIGQAGIYHNMATPQYCTDYSISNNQSQQREFVKF